MIEGTSANADAGIWSAAVDDACAVDAGGAADTWWVAGRTAAVEPDHSPEGRDAGGDERAKRSHGRQYLMRACCSPAGTCGALWGCIDSPW